MAYNDESELTRYVWDHYAHLMSDFERRVSRAAGAREKAVASDSPAMARMLSERWGQPGNPEVDAALSAGAEAFRRATCHRLLSERSGEIVINRCPRCRSVVRTPAARQCFWCGHDRHGSNT